MRNIFIILYLFCYGCYASTPPLKNGDLIFQTSLSSQSKAIQLATKSKYSHCGIIFNSRGTWYVYEAIQPVTFTPLNKWIDRGEGKHFVVKRLKKELTTEEIKLLKKESLSFINKDYDLTFEWSDNKIYCSELIWKVYQRAAGIELGKLQQLKNFDLSHPEIQKIMKQRYGNKIPLEEKVISPVSVFESELLTTVESN